MDPLVMISHLTEGLSSDCAKELQNLIDNLKMMMINQQSQDALARAVEMPYVPYPLKYYPPYKYPFPDPKYDYEMGPGKVSPEPDM